jgi:hypothetical protein
MSRKSRLNRYQIVIGLAGLALLFTTAPAHVAAQAEIGKVSYSGGGNFGSSFAGVGDVNGDGHDDFVVGNTSNGAFGEAVVYSGADLSVIRAWFGDETTSDFGNPVDSAGDVDGDGIEDVIVGCDGYIAQMSGFVRVYSGGTGGLLYEIVGLELSENFGEQVAGVGDLDGDGHGDFAASAPYATGPGGEPHVGAMRVFSGADGHLIAQVHGPLSDQSFGAQLRPAGDFNADGTPDIAIVSRATDLWRLLVYSGAWIVDGTQPAVLLDYSDSAFSCVDAAGDLDLDGWDDLVIGRIGSLFEFGGWRTISGKDHSFPFDFISSDPQNLIGTHVAGAGDLDQDGYPDLLVAGRPADSEPGVWAVGFTRAFSGRDASVLYTCKLYADGDTGWGDWLAGVRDVNGDGYLDWAVGQWGVITLFSPVGIWDDLGQGLAGTAGVPALSGTGLLLGGDAMSLTLADALPDTPFVLVIGLSAVNLPFRGGVWVPDADLLLFDLTDANGGRQWISSWPHLASAQSFYFQAWMEDPLAIEGWSASNGLRAQSP